MSTAPASAMAGDSPPHEPPTDQPPEPPGAAAAQHPPTGFTAALEVDVSSLPIFSANSGSKLDQSLIAPDVNTGKRDIR